MNQTAPPKHDSGTLWRVCIAGVLLCLTFATINFTWEHPAVFSANGGKPIRLIVVLYFFASVIALAALYLGLQCVASKRFVQVIALFAICFRLTQLFATPILEIDLYRYMWDGIVVNNGISPYRFSPTQARTKDLLIEDPDHQKVVRLGTKTESIHRILTKIHFADYTTIYPPVSQAVFATAMLVVPDSASVEIHLLAIKSLLTLFDLATFVIVLRLLRRAKRHPGWSIVYAWNPLIIKEIANSGHLDSIAVFFTTAAVYLFLVGRDEANRNTPNAVRSLPLGRRLLIYGRQNAYIVSALTLALAIGAKLFPVILVPLLALTIGRTSKRSAFLFAAIACGVGALFLIPMAAENPWVKQALETTATSNESHATAREGLTGFLNRWRMNDVPFTFVYENTKPDSGSNANRAWYVFVPNSVRSSIDSFLRGCDITESPPFFCARVITVGIFAVFYLGVLWRISRAMPTDHEFLLHAFAVVAAFFFLQPTQNPWYWLWAIPFSCFVRNKGWLMVSPILFCYYFRFWFKFGQVELSVGGWQYVGVAGFDHVVAWLEHGAILLSVVAWRFGVWMKHGGWMKPNAE